LLFGATDAWPGAKREVVRVAEGLRPDGNRISTGPEQDEISRYAVAHVCLLVPVDLRSRGQASSQAHVVVGAGQSEPLARAVTLVQGLTHHFGPAVAVKIHPVLSPLRAWWCVFSEAVRRRAGVRAVLRAFFVQYRLPAVLVQGRILVSGRWPTFAELRDLVTAFSSDSVPTGPVYLSRGKGGNEAVER